MNISFPIITVIFLFFCVYAGFKKVDIVSAFCEGVKNGLLTLRSIFPTLLFILAVIFAVRSSGIMTALASMASPAANFLHIPSEIVPLALLRPLSGSGSLAVLQDIFNNFGADSYTGFLASVVSASTETTLYTVSIYLGNSSVKCGKLIFAALLLDFVTLLTAAAVTPFFF